MKNQIPKTKIIKLLLLLCLLTMTLVYGFIANEARKEIYYLCGNFGKSDTLTNVVRQLDTSTFSSYTIYTKGGMTEIKHTSRLLLNLKSCNVTFDSDNKFVAVVYK